MPLNSEVGDQIGKTTHREHAMCLPCKSSLEAERLRKEVLPAMQDIIVERLQRSGPVREGIRQFVASCNAAGHRSPDSHFSMEQEFLIK